MSDFDVTPPFTIQEMTVDTIDEAALSRKQGWIDTYVDAEHGITKAWVEHYFAEKLAPAGVEARKKRLLEGKAAGTFNAWVALDINGKVIGSSTAFTRPDGVQDLASIYVDKAWHGSGVGAQLMQTVIDWFDPDKPIELGVVTYNGRAQAFYRKWGFKEIPKSETIFAEKLPEIRMIRNPQNQQEGAQ